MSSQLMNIDQIKNFSAFVILLNYNHNMNLKINNSKMKFCLLF